MRRERGVVNLEGDDGVRRGEWAASLLLAAAFLGIWTAHLAALTGVWTAAPIERWRGLEHYIGEAGVFLILIASGAALIGIGNMGQRRHERNLSAIPLRIHVNGIRGKSTTTRIIGGALRAGGKKTLAKTTGKAARLILWNGKEVPIRREGPPNIREQFRVVEFAAGKGVEALVIECMAVQPELQRVSEQKMVRSTIGVITNVRADHLDIMGPALADVARNLSGTIPRNGILVTAEKRHLRIIREMAGRVGARVVYADPSGVPDELLNRFSYLNFKDNIAIAMEVAKLAGVPREKAIGGMLAARPDPGLVRIYRTTRGGKRCTVINAMGVNDEESTAIVYGELRKRGLFGRHPPTGLFHARADRVSRTVGFGKAMVKAMRFRRIILVGPMTGLFKIEALMAGYPRRKIIELGDVGPEEFMERFSALVAPGEVIFGCGNMVGPIPGKLIEVCERQAARR